MFKADKCYRSSNPHLNQYDENALQPLIEFLQRKVVVHALHQEGRCPACGRALVQGQQGNHRLNLGKRLWLQGWPKQFIPMSYTARMKQNSSTGRENAALCAPSVPTSGRPAALGRSALTHPPCGTQSPAWSSCEIRSTKL